MGLLDGVEKILEDKVFRRMEEQFKELIDEMVNIRTELESVNDKLEILIEKGT